MVGIRASLMTLYTWQSIKMNLNLCVLPMDLVLTQNKMGSKLPKGVAEGHKATIALIAEMDAFEEKHFPKGISLESVQFLTENLFKEMGKICSKQTDLVETFSKAYSEIYPPTGDKL